jgi:hypothetical protein
LLSWDSRTNGLSAAPFCFRPLVEQLRKASPKIEDAERAAFPRTGKKARHFSSLTETGAENGSQLMPCLLFFSGRHCGA